jgi:hypothetical protein
MRVSDGAVVVCVDVGMWICRVKLDGCSVELNQFLHCAAHRHKQQREIHGSNWVFACRISLT